MDNNQTNDLESTLDIHHINKIINQLEILLSQYNIHNNNHYKEWLNEFKKIYGNTETNLRLYIKYALIYFMGLLFISKFMFENDATLPKNNFSLKKLNDLEDHIKFTFNELYIIDFEYFKPIYSISEKYNLEILRNVILKIANFIFSLELNPVYLFDYLFQKIISPLFRHKSGEYYTPPFLVRKMVNETYSFGNRVLDPCCGSGNFLVGIISEILLLDREENEKISAINKVWGFDINPISIYLSKVNILYLSRDFISEIKLNLYVCDFLFYEKDELKDTFDLIIGNPPWYTYRDVESKDYQKALKELAEKLEIKPLPKNVLNLEVSTLFFYKATKDYLKNKAIIFFVITKGVITGSHTSRFRNFKACSDIKIWLFDKRIEKIFNIDFICLYARKFIGSKKFTSFEFPTYHFGLANSDLDVKNYDNINLKLEKEEIFIPFSIEQKGKTIYVKKLIPRSIQEDLLQLGESPYKKLFHKGADLNPRNLIFVQLQEVDDLLVKINPDERIFKKSKVPWNKKEFVDQIIEKKYLFKAVKSTELVKFFIYDNYNVFLPLSKNDLSFNYVNLDKNAKKFYDKINRIYLKSKKETTTHNSLMHNLNRWSKLINSRQLSEIKVIYNNSGSTVNSAVIQGDFLITGDLSFFDTSDLDEAYYLSAILNSSILTEQIKIMKSSRHIFKLPFNLPIKKYNSKVNIHQQIAKLGKKGEEIASSVVRNVLRKNNEKVSKHKIQQKLNVELNSILKQIDELFIQELKLR